MALAEATLVAVVLPDFTHSPIPVSTGFMDFLDHERLEARPLDGFGAQGDRVDLVLHGLAVEVGDL